MKVAIVTDSTFYMNKSLIEQYNIHQVPLMINFEDKTYAEDQFNEAQKEEIFSRIDQAHIIPKTSQPTPESWMACFQDLENQGYDKILVFTVSTEISGTFYGAQAASKMYMEDHDIKIEVFDSGSDANGSSLVLYDVLQEMQRNNRLLSEEEINDIINWHKQTLQVYLLVDDLKYLAYGGRIPKTIAQLGNTLRIKPLIVIPAGKLLEYGKYFSRKKAIKAICDLIDHDTKDINVPMYFTCAYLFAKDDAYQYGDLIASHANCELIELPYASFGSVIGNHVGPNSIGYGWTIPYQYKDQVCNKK